MSDLPLDAMLVNHHIQIVQPPPPLVETPSHADAVSPPIPTEEHIAAVDGVFIRARHEQETLASLIGLRLSVVLMHDLAKDSLPAGEKEETPKQKPDDKPQPAD